jgi:hypothetical protein
MLRACIIVRADIRFCICKNRQEYVGMAEHADREGSGEKRPESRVVAETMRINADSCTYMGRY